MSDDQREPLRMLVFSASLRAESLNARLVRLAAEALKRHGVAVGFASMRNFAPPSYDGDVGQHSWRCAGRRECGDDSSFLRCRGRTVGGDEHAANAARAAAKTEDHRLVVGVRGALEPRCRFGHGVARAVCVAASVAAQLSLRTRGYTADFSVTSDGVFSSG